MPTRVLQHGFAPTTENYGLEAGKWADMPVHAQFLIDLEFLMRYTPPSGASCIYCHSPPYLKEIASQFPWIHFYAYQHTEPANGLHPNDQAEYDPEQPQYVRLAPMTVQVYGNTTTTVDEFTNSIARRLGENHGYTSRVLICHGATPTHQLCLHALLRPNFSLLDIEGLIPPDYPEGEIILPLYIPNHKVFTSMIVQRNAKCRSYSPSLFQDEIGVRPLPCISHGTTPF